MLKHTSAKRTGIIVEWIVFVAVLIVLAIILSPKLPTNRWLSFYIVMSGSMEPTVRTGELAVVKPVDANHIPNRTIVAFISPLDPSDTIMHRIISSRQNDGQLTYVTKGDHNNAVDSWTLQPDQIKGQYIGGLPFIGYVISWVKTPVGFVVAVGIPALGLIILQIQKIREGFEEEVEKRTRQRLSDTSRSVK